MNTCDSETHVLLFPFMSKGHMIPILHLARLLLLRRLGRTTVTLFTTPANLPFVSASISDLPPDKISLVTLPFPCDVPGIPLNVENTEQLPSMSLFSEFASATATLQPHFERSLRSLVDPSPTFLISDGFLWWTLESALRFGIPRLVFYGMNSYAMAVARSVLEENLLDGQASDDEPLIVGAFPWVKVTRNDFDPQFLKPDKIYADFLKNTALATSQSYGMVVNSFKELEPAFVEKWNSVWGPNAWCVGPLCLLETPKLSSESGLLKWLDEKLARGQRVLYIAFGSQAEPSDRQNKEIELGLENSGTIFLWVKKGKARGEGDTNDDDDNECRKLDFGSGVEAKVKGQGVVVRGWIDQAAVLSHDSVQGFMSHCGWNSALESICAGVPLLAWPMMAEQPLNARMVTEEIGVGLRVETVDGSVSGLVTREGVERAVRELMEGEKGEEVRRRMTEVRDMARKATEPGGSSWTALEDLITNVSEERRKMAAQKKRSVNFDSN